MDYIVLSNEVSEARDSGKPVVVMETAGVFEGVSYPENMKLAAEIEETVRREGVIPAFAAIIDGVIKIGLTEEEKEIIANPPAPLLKASRRDIGLLVSTGDTAVTAVAAAMMLAAAAGFKVVSGGGIGGVHRDYANSMDVSADLEEFTKSGVVVVCSGAKVIMDLPFTMEYMETKSVSIVGYKTYELPAYLCRTCGIKLHFKVDSPEEVAKAFAVNQKLGMTEGMLVANPIPEEYSVDSQEMEAAINYAMEQVKEQGIKGKRVTKFILDIVHERMGKDSEESSRQLNINNARVAAQIAKAIYG